MPPANPKPLSFQKNKSLLSSHANVALEASAAADEATRTALLKNERFPTVPLKLGKAALDASGEAPPAPPLATFQLEVLRKGVKIPAKFPDHDPLDRKQLAIRERIVNV